MIRADEGSPLAESRTTRWPAELDRYSRQMLFEPLGVAGQERLRAARAVLIGGKLYMATFDAPRLYYFDRFVGDYRALADSAALGS